jgi:hypothetical protein
MTVKSKYSVILPTYNERKNLPIVVSGLAASTSPERAGAVGMLQAILQATLQGAGHIGYCPKC